MTGKLRTVSEQDIDNKNKKEARLAINIPTMSKEEDKELDIYILYI